VIQSLIAVVALDAMKTKTNVKAGTQYGNPKSPWGR
jgi:hypothetical protein